MTEQELPGLNGQWIAWSEFPAREQDGDSFGCILQFNLSEDGKPGTRVVKWNTPKEDRADFWRPYASRDSRPVYVHKVKLSPPGKREDDSPTALDPCFQVGQHWKTVDGSVVRIEGVGSNILARGVSGPITRMCSSFFLWNYFHTGECYGDNYGFNLVEMIPPGGIKEEVTCEFHLKPGDRCRFLDGPLMLYREGDSQNRVFVYWCKSGEIKSLFLRADEACFVEKVVE